MLWFMAPAHIPRHPLQDNLYYVLDAYRVAKRAGSIYTAAARRRALEIIAEIKGRAK